jgi:hypothetical protein
LKPHKAVACGGERLALVPIGILSVGSSMRAIIEFDDADYCKVCRAQDEISDKTADFIESHLPARPRHHAHELRDRYLG